MPTAHTAHTPLQPRGLDDAERYARAAFAEVCRARTTLNDAAVRLDEAVAQAGAALTAAVRARDFAQVDAALAVGGRRRFRGARRLLAHLRCRPAGASREAAA